MSELPPNIDAILASIRSRMNDNGAGPPEREPDAAELAESEPGSDRGPDLGTVEVAGPSMTLEALVRSMLAPMLQAWLDANMPEIVERLAQDEIKRLTGRA